MSGLADSKIFYTFLCTAERTSTSTAVELLLASNKTNSTFSYTKIADKILGRLHAVLYTEHTRCYGTTNLFVTFRSMHEPPPHIYLVQTNTYLPTYQIAINRTSHIPSLGRCCIVDEQTGSDKLLSWNLLRSICLLLRFTSLTPLLFYHNATESQSYCCCLAYKGGLQEGSSGLCSP